MVSVTIEKGADHWQIFQRENREAVVTLEGRYSIHPSCAQCTLRAAQVMVRVMREYDNLPVLPWTAAQQCLPDDESLHTGRWQARLQLPQGGLYRIETALEGKSDMPQANRMFGGELRRHIGVGDLFVIAGQSNAAGFGMDAAPDQPDLLVHLFRNCLEWDLASHPMNESTDAPDAINAEIGCCGTSPWLVFGKALSRHTGCPVGLVQTAMGGQSIDRWDHRRQGDLLDNLLERLEQAGGKAAGILWYQGCTDAVPGKAEGYGEQFAHLAAVLRSRLGQLPIFTMQLNRYLKNDGDDRAWGLVREAQRQAARQIPGVYVLPTTDLSLSDYIHNSSSANLSLGVRAARLCASVLDGAENWTAPDLVWVRRRGSELHLAFSGAALGFEILDQAARRAFTVEDGRGPVEVLEVEPSAQRPDTLCLRLARQPGSDCRVSFAWQCDPPPASVLEKVTRMPPLSFFMAAAEDEGRE